MEQCFLCPRMCGARRGEGEFGFCHSSSALSVAKTMIHKWEEPCICTHEGAGTIFFAGCNLGCIYCQNMKISRGQEGDHVTESELESIIFDLIAAGVGSIEFVTPTHYTDLLARLLTKIKKDIPIPVVWNSSGYESVSSLQMLDGLIDIYLPDLKYFSDELAEKYSQAPNYHRIAMDAIAEMLRQVGTPTYDDEGALLHGVIVRHLVLPSQRKDSMSVLGSLARDIGSENVILSLMSQYTPDFYVSSDISQRYKELCRRVTTFEYNSVLEYATSLGFDGYFQGASSASSSFTPDF